MANPICPGVLSLVFVASLLATGPVPAESVQSLTEHVAAADVSDRISACRGISYSLHSDAANCAVHRVPQKQMSCISFPSRQGFLLTHYLDVAGEKAEASEIMTETAVQSVFRPVFPDADGKPDSRTKDKQDPSLSPVSGKVFPQFDRLERGGRCLLAVELQINEQWHINSNPATPDFLVPTEVKVLSEQKVRVKNVLYPKHKLLRVNGSDQPYQVYGGKTTIFVQLEADAGETAEIAVLRVQLTFQACNQDTCMPPDEVNLEGKIPFADPGEQIRRINDEKFLELRKKRPKAEEKNSGS